MEIKKATPVRLRDLGLDERWLQDRIEEDPAILGIGDVNIVRREKTQTSGGRIDFLMYDPDRERRYEVEVMLGALDASHIIRTIEYWDVERQQTLLDQTWGVWMHEAEDGTRYVVFPDGTTLDIVNRWPYTVQGQPAVRLSIE